MPAYKCKIAIRDGSVVERVIVADSIAMVKKLVVNEDGFLLNAKKSAGNGFSLGFQAVKKIKPRDFYSFNQEFSVLLKAGLAVVGAFDAIVEKKSDSYFYGLLKDIRDDIASGESVSGAFDKYRDVFSPLYIASLRAGETGGDIPAALAEYIKYMKRTERIKQKIKAASIYPLILICCSFCVVSFLIVFVVPAISESFQTAGASLPFLTLLLLKVSGFVTTYYLPMGLSMVGAVVGFTLFRRSEKGRLMVDAAFLRLPFFGELSICYSTARFSSALAAVLQSGTTLNRAVGISTELVENRYMQQSIKKAEAALEQGEGFAESLRNTGVFPDMALRMIRAGEEGGGLEAVLKDTAEFYERDVEAKLTLVTSSIEPLLMVIMGFVIGVIVLAMYMPIFQMAGTIG